MRPFKASPVTASSFICYIIAAAEYGTRRLVVNALKAPGTDIRHIWLLCRAYTKNQSVSFLYKY
jgi:hypothetical protein